MEEVAAEHASTLRTSTPPGSRQPRRIPRGPAGHAGRRARPRRDQVPVGQHISFRAHTMHITLLACSAIKNAGLSRMARVCLRVGKKEVHVWWRPRMWWRPTDVLPGQEPVGVHRGRTRSPRKPSFVRGTNPWPPLANLKCAQLRGGTKASGSATSSLHSSHPSEIR